MENCFSDALQALTRRNFRCVRRVYVRTSPCPAGGARRASPLSPGGEGALEGKGGRFCAPRGGFMFTLRRALPAGRAALRLYRPVRRRVGGQGRPLLRAAGAGLCSYLAISCRRGAPRFAFIARGEGALEGKGGRFCASRGGFMFTLRRALPAGRAALRLYHPGRCAGVLECKDGRFCASRGGNFQRRKRIPLSFWVVVARGGDLTFRGTPPGRAGRSPPTSP